MALRALDLFCGAGGATRGLQRAGFHVTGVDIRPQPRYCGDEFIQADALNLLADDRRLKPFSLIWASPPCQKFSDLAARNGNGDEWPDLIQPLRPMLKHFATRIGGNYVIENVEGAPLRAPIMLCGTMFPGLRVLRHRLFEANWVIEIPRHSRHPLVHTLDRRKAHFGKTDQWRDFVQVTGGGNSTLAAARDAMGIDWMTKAEINEAIPPAYAELIGRSALGMRAAA